MMKGVHLPFRFLLIVGLLVEVAAAGSFTFSHHMAEGEGSAQVFDGGVLVTDSGSISGQDKGGIIFDAADFSRFGSLGAIANATALSLALDLSNNGLRALVAFDAAYSPSPFSGGDRPGGMAEGSLLSVIEFVMPADEIIWAYQLLIHDKPGFDGSTSVVVENVTASQTLLELTEELLAVESTLQADKGDLIRITSKMSGVGTVPIGVSSLRGYSADLDMFFIVPEPGTAVLVAAGVFSISLRRRRHLYSRHL